MIYLKGIHILNNRLYEQRIDVAGNPLNFRNLMIDLLYRLSDSRCVSSLEVSPRDGGAPSNRTRNQFVSQLIAVVEEGWVLRQFFAEAFNKRCFKPPGYLFVIISGIELSYIMYIE